MYVNIQSFFFKKDPALRFEKHLNYKSDLWRKVWYKYKILGYTEEEAREYLMMILKVPMTRKQFKRWVCRTEVYLKAQPAIKQGAQQVNSSYFGKLQTFVENEVTKNK